MIIVRTIMFRPKHTSQLNIYIYIYISLKRIISVNNPSVHWNACLALNNLLLCKYLFTLFFISVTASYFAKKNEFCWTIIMFLKFRKATNRYRLMWIYHITNGWMMSTHILVTYVIAQLTLPAFVFFGFNVKFNIRLLRFV